MPRTIAGDGRRIALSMLWAFCALLIVCQPLHSVAALPANSDTHREIIDDSGKVIRLDTPARRIITLYAGFSDTLAAMGLAQYVVGRTLSDDSVPSSVPMVGTHMRPNLELTVALHPDLVLLLEGREEAAMTAQALGRLNIPVARFRVASFADLFSCIKRLGALTGEQGKAEALAGAMQERLEAVRRNMLEPRPTVFFEVRYPNLLGAGGNSMPADIIRAAGGIHCPQGWDNRMARLNEESLILMNPDIYLIQEGAMNKNPQALEERPHFRDLAAARNKWCFTVPESRFSRPGPQSVAAVEELADIIMRWHAGSKRRFEAERPQERRARPEE